MRDKNKIILMPSWPEDPTNIDNHTHTRKEIQMKEEENFSLSYILIVTTNIQRQVRLPSAAITIISIKNKFRHDGKQMISQVSTKNIK
jgi:hypothetical protein